MLGLLLKLLLSTLLIKSLLSLTLLLLTKLSLTLLSLHYITNIKLLFSVSFDLILIALEEFCWRNIRSDQFLIHYMLMLILFLRIDRFNEVNWIYVIVIFTTIHYIKNLKIWFSKLFNEEIIIFNLLIHYIENLKLQFHQFFNKKWGKMF